MTWSDGAAMLALHMDKGYKSENLETSGGGTEKEMDSALGHPRRSCQLLFQIQDLNSNKLALVHILNCGKVLP